MAYRFEDTYNKKAINPVVKQQSQTPKHTDRYLLYDMNSILSYLNLKIDDFSVTPEGSSFGDNGLHYRVAKSENKELFDKIASLCFTLYTDSFALEQIDASDKNQARLDTYVLTDGTWCIMPWLNKINNEL